MEITKEIKKSEEQYIKFVANYLRKSRGEGNEDLEKHKMILTELCQQHDWKYVEYFEIESGDSIVVRPVFQKLLQDIENGLYDAVCVVDIDRLGRGDKGDQDKIQKTFIKSNTLIATPSKIYNLYNEDDEFVVDMKGFLARREYKMIVKRLSQGKKVGSKRGDWTNGIPPYPYEYERYNDKYNSKGLVVNDEKYKIYRYIIDSVVKNNIPPSEIAWDLNKQGIPSPRNGIWHPNTVQRILVDETHLGKIISNKSRGDGHKNKKPNATDVQILPKSEWVVVENCHQAAKTQEEHDAIITFLHRKTKTPTRTSHGEKAFSGLIKCGICGHTMNLLTRSDRRTPDSVKPCWYKDAYGNKCPNRGGLVNKIYKVIPIELYKYEQELREDLLKDEGSEMNALKLQIQRISKEIDIKEKSLKKIHEAYEADVYTLPEFKERKNIVSIEIGKLEEKANALHSQLNRLSSIKNEDRLKNIEIFREKIKNENLTELQKNRLYKSIIEKITWKRIGDDFDIDVTFL